MFVQFFKWHQDILFVMMPDESRNDANNLEMHLRTRLMRARTSACMPSIAFAQSFGITLHRLRFLRPCTIDSRTFREKTSANVKHKVVCAVDFLRFWPWVKNYFGGLRFLVPHLCKILYNNGLGSMCARRQAKYRMHTIMETNYTVNLKLVQLQVLALPLFDVGSTEMPILDGWVRFDLRSKSGG